MHNRTVFSISTKAHHYKYMKYLFTDAVSVLVFSRATLALALGLALSTGRVDAAESPGEAADQADPATSVVSNQEDWRTGLVEDFSAELPTFEEDKIQVTIHVDGSAGLSGADGSIENPFPMIAAARGEIMKNLEAGIPTRLQIGAGVYSEDLRQWLRFDDETVAQKTLLVIEGAPEGGTILSGSVEEHNRTNFRPDAWQEVPDQPGLFVNDWPFSALPDAGPWINSYGFAMLPGLMQRSEMIWVDGMRMRQVLSERYRWEDPDGPAGYKDRGTGKGGDENNQPGQLVYDGLQLADPADLTDPGTFAVFSAAEAPDDVRGKIFLRLPDGVRMADVERIEVGQWKGAPWAPLLAIRGKHNLVLRNLSFRHATAGPMGTTLALNECQNFLIERVTVSDNVASGIAINRSSRGILRSVVANDNGSNGLGLGDGTNRILIEDSETSFNNYRGGWAGWTAWHASGSKSGGTEHIHFRRHASVGNYANGLWFDVYCRNILIEDSFFLGNKRMGVMLELTRPRGGPQVLVNSISAFNDNTGVFLSMASNSIVAGNLLIGNGGGGFVENEAKNTQILYKFAPHPQGPKSAEDWQSVIVRDNIIASADGKISDYISNKSEPAEQFTWVLKVLDSNQNTYWSADAMGFRLPDGSWGDLDQWRELLAAMDAPGGRDAGSQWENPGLNADPRMEFTRASDSAVTDRARTMGVVLPQASIAEYWRRVDAGLYASPHLHYRAQHD